MWWSFAATGDPHGGFTGHSFAEIPGLGTAGGSVSDEEASASLEQVLRRAELGDRDAFAELVQRYSADVTRLCRRLLGDDAEDAHSEVFLRAQQAFPSYERSRPFRSWLLAIAGHHCTDRLRRRSVEGRLFAPGEVDPDQTQGQNGTPLRSLLQARERDRLGRALGALPERDRLVLELRYFAEMSYAEIGEAVSLDANAVGVALHRAKARLRRAVGGGSG